MGVEIERKFLLTKEWNKKDVESSIAIRQGYVPTNGCTVRVRLANDKALLTIKSKATNISRSEYEYEIPFGDAVKMLDTLCHPEQIHKTRHLVKYCDHLWEVDEFHGDNEGLFVAEIELKSEEEDFARPPWIGEEVSCDRQYSNASLAHYPFNTWEKE